ncbi:hypothetical protein DFH05DRAFT_1555898 [Lentinula detonsa]|uniref:Uncharacterized protein n=1 Tax=Lentinula detonsa TaxID=2804962 RepID=A0A9W8P6Z2_9AGAR|nr:hypothetical protein DFH05DRAFT_1555898 [Lentinula detonsa]
MQCIKLVFLTAIFSLSSASFLIGRQSSDTCNASNACISASGCTGTCAPVSSGGGPAVCQDVCVVDGEAVSIFCPACYAGDAESGGFMRRGDFFAEIAVTTIVMYIEE